MRGAGEAGGHIGVGDRDGEGGGCLEEKGSLKTSPSQSPDIFPQGLCRIQGDNKLM